MTGPDSVNVSFGCILTLMYSGLCPFLEERMGENMSTI